MDSRAHHADQARLVAMVHQYEAELSSLRNEVSILTSQKNTFSNKIKDITAENERLHSEIQGIIQEQLEEDQTSDPQDSDAAVKILLAQVELANKEKDAAVEMNKQTMSLLDNVRHERASEVTHGRSRERLLDEVKCRNEQLEDTNLHMHSLIESTQKENETLAYTATQQMKELKSCQEQFRETKQKLIEGAKREEAQKKTITALNKKNEDLECLKSDVDHKCQMIATRNQQLEASLLEAEGKLAQALQTATNAQSQCDNLKVRLSSLEKINSEIEGKEMNYLMQLRESSQLLDDALLARDSALMREKQRTEDVENSTAAMEALVQEVADRVKSEVDKVKSQCNANIRRLMDELESLELECANLRSEANRAKRVKRSVEEEMEAMSRLREDSKEKARVEDLQRRTINAERARDDSFITIEKLESKIKKLDSEHNEEKMRLLSSSQGLEQRVKRLERETEECQHERLHLLEAVNQYKHENQALQETARSARLNATKEFTATRDALVKQKKQLETRLQCQDETNRASIQQLHKMLADQQRISARWKEESESASERNEEKVRDLQSQVTRHRRKCHDLTNRLKNNTERSDAKENTVPAQADTCDETRKLPKTLPLEETNRRLRAELHQTQYKLLSATERLGEAQALNNSLTIRDLH